MSAAVLLSEEQLTEAVIRILMRELGPVETARVVAMMSYTPGAKDSVQRHREWADSVDNDAFVDLVFEAMAREEVRRRADAS